MMCGIQNEVQLLRVSVPEGGRKQNLEAFVPTPMPLYIYFVVYKVCCVSLIRETFENLRRNICRTKQCLPIYSLILRRWFGEEVELLWSNLESSSYWVAIVESCALSKALQAPRHPAERQK